VTKTHASLKCSFGAFTRVHGPHTGFNGHGELELVLGPNRPNNQTEETFVKAARKSIGKYSKDSKHKEVVACGTKRHPTSGENSSETAT
jgi:hypothetical protein